MHASNARIRQISATACDIEEGLPECFPRAPRMSDALPLIGVPVYYC